MGDVKSSFLASENNSEDKDMMKTISYYSYTPQRYANAADTAAESVRRFIYAFKDGKRNATDYAVRLVANSLAKWYGVSCQDYVLCCIPAATNAKYTRRFKRFAAEVSRLTGIQNGTRHVSIFGKREAKHNNSRHIVSESCGYVVSADPEFFKGKNVILFDDLVTTGATAEEFAAELEAIGANVLGAIFLARTKRFNN